MYFIVLIRSELLDQRIREGDNFIPFPLPGCAAASVVVVMIYSDVIVVAQRSPAREEVTPDKRVTSALRRDCGLTGLP